MSEESLRLGLGRPGATADSPAEIPARGWRQIAKRIAVSVYEQNLVVIAAGLGFFALLSIFPMLIAIVSIYGLIADPVAVETQVGALAAILPSDARAVLTERLNEIVTASGQGLGLGAFFSIIASLWAASKAVTYLFMSLNVAYGEKERRHPIKLKLTALLFTLGFVLFVVFAVGLVGVLPPVLALLGVGGWTETIFRMGRWPVLALATMFGLAVLYRYGPNRRHAKWRWISPGAVIATVAWLGLSSLFSLYVSNFGKFNEIYGSIGTPIALMLWFFLSCLLLLLGAEINAKSEHQTERDSTVAPEKPKGSRGAVVADTTP
jgi:membrane protein